MSKQKNIQPDNKAQGDNTINTKKGFLISLPAKKKSNDTTSGIVMAKTVNNTQENKPVFRDAKNNNSNSHNNNKNGKNFNKNQQTSDGEANRKKAVQKEGERHNNTNHHSKHHGKHNKNQGQKKDNNQNQQKNNEQRQQPHGKKQDRREKNQSKQFKMELSPLSREMRSYAKASSERVTSADEIMGFGTKELSLEEKYKDAIPLAEQIAIEQQKRKAKPRAMVTNNIDRTKISNAELESMVFSEEGAERKHDDKENSTLIQQNEGKQYEVVGIRFREAGKIYYFDPDGKDVPYGTPVIVETARGAEYGYTAISNRLVPFTSVVPPLKKIKRIATPSDTEKYIANKALEEDAAKVFKQKVEQLKLEMNLIFVEYTFDNSKLLFYFTAETRIDFRELVKELASVFRTRIELRQIGARDEAKILGGLGACGRGVCCNSFLGDFAQVSIKMAKDQGLSLNSAKISGACGKLMCCLRYEDKVYEEEMARTPKVGSVVETNEGRGVVTEAYPLKGIVKVSLENSPEAPPKPFDRAQVKVVGFNKAAVKEDAEQLKELKALEDNT